LIAMRHATLGIQHPPGPWDQVTRRRPVLIHMHGHGGPAPACSRSHEPTAAWLRTGLGRPHGIQQPPGPRRPFIREALRVSVVRSDGSPASHESGLASHQGGTRLDDESRLGLHHESPPLSYNAYICNTKLHPYPGPSAAVSYHLQSGGPKWCGALVESRGGLGARP
jgi:hypothetical protein